MKLNSNAFSASFYGVDVFHYVCKIKVLCYFHVLNAERDVAPASPLKSTPLKTMLISVLGPDLTNKTFLFNVRNIRNLHLKNAFKRFVTWLVSIFTSCPYLIRLTVRSLKLLMLRVFDASDLWKQNKLPIHAPQGEFLCSHLKPKHTFSAGSQSFRSSPPPLKSDISFSQKKKKKNYMATSAFH